MKCKSVCRTVGLLLLFLLLSMALCACSKETPTAYTEKAAALQQQVLHEDVVTQLGYAPAGAVGHAVFLSVCDGAQQAQVFVGTGHTLQAAWSAADATAEQAVKKLDLQPQWIRADAVCLSEEISLTRLETALAETSAGKFHYGISLDEKFHTAVLETELNYGGIYNYNDCCVEEAALKEYLKQTNRKAVSKLPDTVTVFQCIGWICEADGTIAALQPDGSRKLTQVSKEQAEALVHGAADYLATHQTKDGAFSTFYAPLVGVSQQTGSMREQAAAILSMAQDENVPEQALALLLAQIVETDDAAYVNSGGELPLDAAAMTVLALRAYSRAAETDAYDELCQKLGRGILNCMDAAEGSFVHVRGIDLTEKEPFRSISCDGLALAALCELYSMHGDGQWLEAAEMAADHMIAQGHAFYQDTWVAAGMYELAVCTEEMDYAVFVLQNAVNIMDGSRRGAAAQELLLQLLYGLNMYEHLLQRGVTAAGFNEAGFRAVIDSFARSAMDSCFLPESAMYTANPGQVLGGFMTRSSQYRINLEDVVYGALAYELYADTFGFMESLG